MSKYIMIIFVLLLYSCSQKVSDKYAGYVYYAGQPLIGMKITECETENNNTYTDKNGYFILKRENKDRINDIIIHNNDTIKLKRGGGAGSSIYYLLLDKTRIDTLDLERERFFKQ